MNAGLKRLWRPFRVGAGGSSDRAEVVARDQSQGAGGAVAEALRLFAY